MFHYNPATRISTHHEHLMSVSDGCLLTTKRHLFVYDISYLFPNKGPGTIQLTIMFGAIIYQGLDSAEGKIYDGSGRRAWTDKPVYNSYSVHQYYAANWRLQFHHPTIYCYIRQLVKGEQLDIHVTNNVTTRSSATSHPSFCPPPHLFLPIVTVLWSVVVSR